MAKVTVYNLEGKKVEDMELSDAVFGCKSNNDLLHQVYVAIEANRRQVLAHTKGVGQRSGSGKKPWKQKGTGNARVGQKRNPIWRGGGVSMGPTKDRNFSKDINKKMKRKAVMVALSEKVRMGNMVIVERLEFAEAKTKQFNAALKSLELKGKVLVALDEKQRKTALASRNIKNISNVAAKNLNVFDLLNNQKLLISKESVKFIEEKFSKQ
jgi:large subunit ribosomal protein L4